MTCLSVEPTLTLATPSKWEAVRATVFWGFVLMVIASPAALSAWILMHA